MLITLLEELSSWFLTGKPYHVENSCLLILAKQKMYGKEISFGRGRTSWTVLLVQSLV